MNGRRSQNRKAFLGTGWAFPFTLEADGSLSTAAYEEDVRQAVCIILGTNRGERVMRPDFGAGLEDFLFEPVTATTRERIATRVREALVDWEPRIDVLEVTVETPDLPSRLDITVRFRIRATNTLHNLVYPFYLDEGTAQ